MGIDYKEEARKATERWHSYWIGEIKKVKTDEDLKKVLDRLFDEITSEYSSDEYVREGDPIPWEDLD